MITAHASTMYLINKLRYLDKKPIEYVKKIYEIGTFKRNL